MEASNWAAFNGRPVFLVRRCDCAAKRLARGAIMTTASTPGGRPRFGRARLDGRRRARARGRAIACSRCRSTITSATRSNSPPRGASPTRSAPSATSSCRSTCRAFGGSALTADIDVPKDGVGDGIPVTYVPGAQHDLPQPGARLGRGGGRARPVSSASTRSIIRAIPIAAPNSSPRSRSMAELATKAGVEGEPLPHPRAAPAHDQGRYRPRGDAARARRSGMSWSCYDPAPGGAALRAVRQLPAAREGLRGSGLARSDASTPSDADELCGQGDVPDAAGRGRECRAPRGVRALRRLQSVVGPRAGSRDRGLPVLRHRFRRHRRRWAAASSPMPQALAAAVARLLGRRARASASSC